jgi:SAM-dependent methyltransferase
MRSTHCTSTVAGVDHHHDVHFESPAMAAYTELQGDVLGALAADAIAVLAEEVRRQDQEVRRVLDIGCGPGVATVELARRFPAARVVALDGSAAMLARAAARLTRSGVADRVETLLAELPGGLAPLDRADVVWASMVLHHVGDERAALRQVRAVLAPGGLLALVERARPLRVRPARPDAGLWDRLDAAAEHWFAGMRAALPDAASSADYPSMLGDADLDVVADEVLTLDLDAPLDGPARRFAHEHLTHARTQLDGHADPADLAALDELLAAGFERSDDLSLHASCHFYVSRAMRG